MPLDVRRSPELQAVLLGLKRAERELRNDINKQVRPKATALWNEALLGHVSTRLEQRVIVRGARVKVGVRNITAQAGTSTKKLAGGLVPADNWAPVEFGARQRSKTFTTTSRRGNRYKVTKTIGAQFRPRTKQGYVAMPAAAIVITKVVGLWVREIVDQFDAFADVKAGR